MRRGLDAGPDTTATTLKIAKSFKQNVDSQEKEHRFIRSLVEIIKVGKKKVVVE